MRAPRRPARKRHPRGQAMAETVVLTTALVGWGAALVYFWPDSINALQIYIDGFYYVLSLPIP